MVDNWSLIRSNSFDYFIQTSITKFIYLQFGIFIVIMEKPPTNTIDNEKKRMESVKACCAVASSAVQKRLLRCCSLATVKRHLPILKWLPGYGINDFTSDMVAGFTIGLTIIPQSMAYASIAGLPPQYGLYAAFMGSFMYCIFGSTEAINIGPTAIMGLLTAVHVKRGGPDAAVLLCFYAGCFELACGILNLGFLIDFISAPVISGFSSAAAIIISTTQLKGLLGVHIDDETFMGVVTTIQEKKNLINYYDLGLGLGCVLLLFLLRILGTIRWKTADIDIPVWKRVLRKSLWLISAGRNAIIVILASLMTFILMNRGSHVFSITGEIDGGLPPFKPPNFRITDTAMYNNVTRNELDSFKDFGSGLILVPLLAILEHIAIAKVFARGKSLDSTQELISLGVASIAGSFVLSFPVSGSFSRTALNASCGVKTPLGGVLTGIIVLLAIAFLAPTFFYIPKASLSAVIITAVIVMIEYRLLPYLWKTKKTDLLIMLLTFVCCIFSQVEYGILVGICASIAVLLYNTARPKITSELIIINGKEHILIRPDRMLNFPSVEYLRARIMKATKKNERIPAILDGVYLCGMDYTVIQCVNELIDEFKQRNQTLIFVNLKDKVVKKIKVLEPKGFIYYDSMTELETAITNGVVFGSENIELSVISNGNIQNSYINCDQESGSATYAKGDVLPSKEIKTDDAVVYLPDLSEERQSKL
uniref:STAS domain-containing protein n=1 Tax=Strigamia maritima TaxID=126957 RepID=T1J2U4_STRMM